MLHLDNKLWQPQRRGVLENDRVCEKHFVSGRAAKSWEKFNIDWVPTSVEEIIKNWGRNEVRGRGSVAELVKKADSKEPKRARARASRRDRNWESQVSKFQILALKEEETAVEVGTQVSFSPVPHFRLGRKSRVSTLAVTTLLAGHFPYHGRDGYRTEQKWSTWHGSNDDRVHTGILIILSITTISANYFPYYCDDHGQDITEMYLSDCLDNDRYDQL